MARVNCDRIPETRKLKNCWGSQTRLPGGGGHKLGVAEEEDLRKYRDRD